MLHSIEQITHKHPQLSGLESCYQAENMLEE